MRQNLFLNEERKSVERSRSVERHQPLRKRQRRRGRSISRSPKKKKLNATKMETSQQVTFFLVDGIVGFISSNVYFKISRKKRIIPP